MSGGVNGAIGERCDGIQDELRARLNSIGQSAVPAGTVIRTSAGTLPFSHIIHAIEIDPFYDSTHQLVADTLTAAFNLACSLGALSVSLPTSENSGGVVVPIQPQALSQSRQRVDSVISRILSQILSR